MSNQTWIAVGAKGTKVILEAKNKLKGARQRNTNCKKDLIRQLAYFADLEGDNGGLDTPSVCMKTALMKIQKGKESTENTLDIVTGLVSDLLCLLAEIQHQSGISEDHIKEIVADIGIQEKKLEERAEEVHTLVRKVDVYFRRYKMVPCLYTPSSHSNPWSLLQKKIFCHGQS